MNMELNGVEYPLVFNMNAIRNVMDSAGMEDFDKLMDSKNLGQQLDFALFCAYHGINEGAACNGKDKPFILIADLGRQIKNYNQLLPAVEAFTKAVTEFFQIESEGK